MAKQPSIQNMQQLRYKLTELWDQVSDKTISNAEAKTKVGIAMAIIKSVSTEMIHDATNDQRRQIDFMQQGYKLPESNLKNEFLEDRKSMKAS